ncbi:MAG: helix-turn-helix domain-containing protein [Vitreoscilla sp.]
MSTKSIPTVHQFAPGVLSTRLDSAQVFPRHAHDTYGIGRLQRGMQRSWSAAGWVQAGPGDMLMVNPGEVHDGIPLDAAGRRWQMLYLSPALVEAAAAEVLASRGAVPMWRPVARDAVLARAFERWHARLAAGEGRLACDEAQVGLLAALLLRQAQAVPERLASPSIARARERLDDDPATDPGLAALADEARLSRFQLLRAFARELGMTPHAYLVQRRLALARSLLDAGQSIADAAAAAGFADQSHLTRSFKRCLGYTPAAYARARG